MKRTLEMVSFRADVSVLLNRMRSTEFTHRCDMKDIERNYIHDRLFDILNYIDTKLEKKCK